MTLGDIEGIQAWLNAWIRVPSFETDFVSIPFLLDTGSTQSVIQPVDVRRMGIGVEALFPDPRSVSISGFGGDIRMLLTSAELRVGPNIPLRLVAIGIAEPTAGSWRLPSVLGMDFLQHFRVTISVTEGLVELVPLP